jgi:DNA-directed RNA polymerase specialized sigma24 family protein
VILGPDTASVIVIALMGRNLLSGIGDAVASLMGMQALTKAEVFESYGVELTSFATSLVGPAEAQDVVSEALLRSMWSSNWENVLNQRAYLYTAVVSQARMNHRAASRRRERERRTLPVLVVGTLEGHVDVWETLGHLTVDERAVVFLIYWEDLTNFETAERIGASERTVRRRLGRARHKLGRLLHE